jgi:hypothetical protein
MNQIVITENILDVIFERSQKTSSAVDKIDNND